MAGDLRSARSEMLSLCTKFWLLAPDLVGLSGKYPDMVIADVDRDGNPDEVNPAAGGNRLPFARVRVQHTQSLNRAISGRRYRNTGVLTANLFVPLQRSDANLRCILLGDALSMALRKHRGNVYFTGVTPRERPINNGFNQVDVVSDFFWDQFIGA